MDIWVNCVALRQEVQKQNHFSVPNDCAHDFWGEKVYLNFFFAGDGVSLHMMGCCFDSEVACDTHILSPVTIYHLAC